MKKYLINHIFMKKQPSNYNVSFNFEHAQITLTISSNSRKNKVDFIYEYIVHFTITETKEFLFSYLL